MKFLPSLLLLLLSFFCVRTSVNSVHIYRTEDDTHPLLSVIRHLTQMMSEEEFTLRIRRTNVMEDTLLNIRRRTFSPYKKLIVSSYVKPIIFTVTHC